MLMTLRLFVLNLDPRRSATRKQRREISERAGGCCEVLLNDDNSPCLAGVPGLRCQKLLRGSWVAGHFPALWSHGGSTTLDNLRGECVVCSRKVGALENSIAKKVNRMQKHHETGRGTKRKGQAMKSRGFSKKFTRKMNGKVVLRKIQ